MRKLVNKDLLYEILCDFIDVRNWVYSDPYFHCPGSETRERIIEDHELRNCFIDYCEKKNDVKFDVGN